ncbi:MAG TPA: inner membrane CreD family protein [Thermoanaerobaculaceae bacterium]|nr:inner membrane CreD family protein [Thermoanaerobaculaceae bacterium]HRS16918.1 inner membrane CreD family protein [Thermoanaerobaculaceae bacterium]
MVRTVAGIVAVFVLATLAWMLLGASVSLRTNQSDQALRRKVGQLWGTPLDQPAPAAQALGRRLVTATETSADGKESKQVTRERETARPAPLVASDVEVDLHLDQRRKGLLWYSTFRVRLAGEYRFEMPPSDADRIELTFRFPAANGMYDEFTFEIDGVRVPFVREGTAGVKATLPSQPGRTHVLKVGYVTQGLDRFVYSFGQGIGEVRDFRLAARTDFDGFDFPDNTMSPTRKQRQGGGWELVWQYKDLITGNGIGIETPKKLNPGPMAARISFFAPVSLGFFFFLVFVIATLKGIRIHPVNYFFLASAFFAFHLLLAYLVDHLAVGPAFAICAAVSVFLVVSYMRLVAGPRFAFVEVALAQLVYLVGFSLAFFFEGYTGLTVTAGAIATLFLVMQLTGRTDWHAAEARQRA